MNGEAINKASKQAIEHGHGHSINQEILEPASDVVHTTESLQLKFFFVLFNQLISFFWREGRWVIKSFNS